MRVPDFSQAHLLIAGDAMLDQYWSGPTARISPEAPVPVVNVRQAENRAGGAANVALGVVALGARARLVSRLGQDEAARSLTDLLRQHEVSCACELDPALQTITKLRVLSHHQQMIRLDFEPPPGAAAAITPRQLRSQLEGVDAVVLSDYGKGALLQVQGLIECARDAGKPVLVDPKQADFSVYRGATIVTPNRAEFERALGPCTGIDELVSKGMAAMEAYRWDALLITRSEEGMTLLERGQPPLHIPAQAQEVFDVTGAGDTVIAVLAAARACHRPWQVAARLANLAAGVAVGKLGTATVSRHELIEAAETRARTGRGGIVDEATLLACVQAARARGERVVMTNGCFDLLHAGHVHYLAEARALGDRLVVAVNDDGSVRRLKGPTRPVLPLEDRLAILAALSAVDWVVPFGEDTPARLIGAVAPDVLVKGGDYRPEQIAGHDSVTARGGRVQSLGFMPGRSSSHIIGNILQRG